MKTIAAISLLCAGCFWAGYYMGKQLNQDSSAIPVQKPAAVPGLGFGGRVAPPSSSSRQSAGIESVFGLPAGGSLVQRLDAAKMHIREPFYSAAISALIANMEASETQSVFEWLQQPGNTSRDFPRIWELFWMRHGAVDIGGAITKAGSAKKNATGGSWQVKHMFEGLAQTAPDKATQALQNLTDPKDIAWAVEGVAVRWAEIDAAAATRWGLQQEDPEYRHNVLRAIPFGVLLKNGVAGLTDWWKSLPQEERAGGFEKAVRPVLESRSPQTLPHEGLWQLMAAGHEDGITNEPLNRLWAAAAGKSDGEGSYERLASHPSSAALAGPFFGQWVLSDAEKAVAALESLPETSPLQQPALEAAALSLATSDVEKSMSLARRITDAGLRERLEAQIQSRSEPPR